MNFLLPILALSPLSYASVCTPSNFNPRWLGDKYTFMQSGTKTYGLYTIKSLSGYFSVVDGCTLGVSITLGPGDLITPAMGIQVYGRNTNAITNLTRGFPISSTVISGTGIININVTFDSTDYVISTSNKGVSWADIVSLTLYAPSGVPLSGWQVSVPIISNFYDAFQSFPAFSTKTVSGTSTPSPTTSNADISSISMISIISLLFLIVV